MNQIEKLVEDSVRYVNPDAYFSLPDSKKDKYVLNLIQGYHLAIDVIKGMNRRMKDVLETALKMDWT